MPNHDCDNFPTGNQFMTQMQEYAREHAVPISGTFELTPRCNFNCKMCYVHLAEERIPLFGREMDAAEWIRLAEEARDAGMLSLCITGGEPILHPEFAAIYSALSQMGFYITLQTNASTLSGKILDLLEQYPPYQVKTTIYGSNNQIYEDVCGVKDGFTRADAGIRALQSLQIPVIAVTTVIKQNMHDLANIYQYTQGRKIPWIYSTTVYPSVRGANTNITGISIDEETATDYRADIRHMINHPFRKKDDRPCEHCKGFRLSFYVTWDGKMRFCPFMNEPDYLLKEQDFINIWHNLVNYEENLRWPKECYNCEVSTICQLCAGSLAARSGSINKIDREFCKKFKKYVSKEKEDI